MPEHPGDRVDCDRHDHGYEQVGEECVVQRAASNLLAGRSVSELGTSSQSSRRGNSLSNAAIGEPQFLTLTVAVGYTRETKCPLISWAKSTTYGTDALKVSVGDLVET